MSSTRTPGGHIKLARKAFDSTHGDMWWLEPRTFSKWEAWVDLLQLAQWKDFRHVTAHGPVELKRGEFIASLRWLGARWKWGQERVRRYLAAAVETGRLARQREERDGTVYLVVNYDTYQSMNRADETPGETASKTPARQRRDKNEAGKAGKAEKQGSADARAKLEVLPKALCDAAWEKWVATLGATDYAQFRKALLPVYQSTTAHHPTEAELVGSVIAFDEARTADKPAFRHYWTPRKWAGDLTTYVRLGGMEYVDEWGTPTERGRLIGLGEARAA